MSFCCHDAELYFRRHSATLFAAAADAYCRYRLMFMLLTATLNE